MERRYYKAKSHVVRFKVDFCCWFVPVKIGLTIVGYFNIIADVICLIGIANDGFSPTIIRVQETLIEDFVSKPVPVLAYATELGFNVVLLCGIFRKDQVLLRVFMYYTLAAVVMSFLVYSIIIIAVPVQIQVAIVFSTVFQMYTILLVRSVIVEIKIGGKKYELPRLVMSSHLKDKIIIPSSSYPKQIQEVIITELPAKQEVRLAIVDKEHETIKDEAVVIEVQKDAEVKKEDNEINKYVDLEKVNGETKKDVEVTIESEAKSIEKRIEEKKNKEENEKEERKIKEEREKEEKRIKEEKEKEEKKIKEKEKEEKRIKEEKEKEEKKIKEEKKKEEKKLKEEKKKEEKRIKEEKKKEEKKIKHEKKKEGKGVKDEKQQEENASNGKENNVDIKDVENQSNPTSSKDKQEVRQAWLQTVTEHPK